MCRLENPNNVETWSEFKGNMICSVVIFDLRSCHEMSSESAFLGSSIMIRTELTGISIYIEIQVTVTIIDKHCNYDDDSTHNYRL